MELFKSRGNRRLENKIRKFHEKISESGPARREPCGSCGAIHTSNFATCGFPHTEIWWYFSFFRTLKVMFEYFFLLFTFSSEKLLDLCKMGPPPVFVKCPRFETLWTRKNGFRECVCMPVCMSVYRFIVC